MQVKETGLIGIVSHAGTITSFGRNEHVINQSKN